MLRVTTNTDIDPFGAGTWAVKDTDGRTLFTGSVFDCARIAARGLEAV